MIQNLRKLEHCTQHKRGTMGAKYFTAIASLNVL
jgi:hypothetical protein